MGKIKWKTNWFLQHLKLIILLLLIQTTLSISEDSIEDDFDEELSSVIDAVGTEKWTVYTHQHNRMTRDIKSQDNATFWMDIYNECHRRTTFSCIKTGVFKYLDKNLQHSGDMRITDGLFFNKNKNKYSGICENSLEERDRCFRYNNERNKILNNEIDVEDTRQKDSTTKVEKSEDSTEAVEEDVTEDGRSLNGLSDVSDLLYDKGTQFLMTHDMELQLPELFFGGGSIKIEPKSFDDKGGALVRLDFQPRAQEEGRLHFSIIKKLFKKKLMHSFMALMLIIKMIKIKVMFLLPMIVGQSAAKKLLLKVLLFLIPGLAHLFKLCHYYHMNHAKYHHHHHLIKHHHHHVKVPVPVPVPVHHHVEPPIHHHHESPGPYSEQGHGGGGGDDYYPGPVPLDNGPPGQTYDYPPVGSESNNVYNRHEYGTLSQYNDNEAEMSSWGLGTGSSYPDAGVLDAKDQPSTFSNYGYDNRFKKSPTPSAQPQPYYPPKYHLTQQMAKQQYATKLQALTPRPVALGTTVPVTYDSFYSPILQKIDNIFVQLGFNEEACRERLVCSMYKSPHKFSPHSNLLSAELSRDSKDLQKPLVNNSAVVRFYRYVQAARDGQSQKDCLRLYPACTVNTEAG